MICFAFLPDDRRLPAAAECLSVMWRLSVRRWEREDLSAEPGRSEACPGPQQGSHCSLQVEFYLLDLSMTACPLLDLTEMRCIEAQSPGGIHLSTVAPFLCCEVWRGSHRGGIQALRLPQRFRWARRIKPALMLKIPVIFLKKRLCLRCCCPEISMFWIIVWIPCRSSLCVRHQSSSRFQHLGVSEGVCSEVSQEAPWLPRLAHVHLLLPR